MNLQVVLSAPGETMTLTVIWLDENAATHTTDIVAELMNQDEPRLLGVKVDGKPVLLRSSDIVFHSANPREIKENGQ